MIREVVTSWVFLSSLKMLLVLWSYTQWNHQTIFHCSRKSLLAGNKDVGRNRVPFAGILLCQPLGSRATARLPIPSSREERSPRPSELQWLGTQTGSHWCVQAAVPGPPFHITSVSQVSPPFLNSENCLVPSFLWGFHYLAHDSPLRPIPAVILGDFSIPRALPLSVLLSALSSPRSRSNI